MQGKIEANLDFWKFLIYDDFQEMQWFVGFDINLLTFILNKFVMSIDQVKGILCFFFRIETYDENNDF